MRRIGWHIGTRSGERGIARAPQLARGVGSQEEDYHSQSAVLREIAWCLAGWLGFVVVVQLLLHVFGIG